MYLVVLYRLHLFMYIQFRFAIKSNPTHCTLHTAHCTLRTTTHHFISPLTEQVFSSPQSHISLSNLGHQQKCKWHCQNLHFRKSHYIYTTHTTSTTLLVLVVGGIEAYTYKACRQLENLLPLLPTLLCQLNPNYHTEQLACSTGLQYWLAILACYAGLLCWHDVLNSKLLVFW